LEIEIEIEIGFALSRVFSKRNLTNFRLQRLEKYLFGLPGRNRKATFSRTRGHFKAKKQSSPENPPDWAGGDEGRRNKE